MPIDIDLSQLMTKYSQAVQKNGFFLELIDGQMYAEMQSRRLLVVDSVANPVITFLDAAHIISCLAPGSIFDDHGPLPPDSKGSLTDIWGLCCVSALYDMCPMSPRNHWIPIIFKNQVSEEVWMAATTLAQKELRVKSSDLKKKLMRLEELEDELGEDEEDKVLWQSRCESVQREITQLLVLRS